MHRPAVRRDSSPQASPAVFESLGDANRLRLRPVPAFAPISSSSSLRPAVGTLDEDDEQRAAPRLKLAPGRARVQLGHRRHREQPVLHDVSPRGGSFVLPRGSRWADATGVSATVHLPNEPAFKATFAELHPRIDRSGQVRVGGRFHPLEPQALRSLSRFVVREHLAQPIDLERLRAEPKAVRTRDRAAIAKLLAARAIYAGTPLQVLDGDGTLPVELTLESVAAAGSAGALIEAASESLFASCAALDDNDLGLLLPGEVYTFLLRGRCSVMLFDSQVQLVRDDQVRLAFPGELVQTGFRTSHRPRLTAATATASFILPWAPVRLECPLLDVSAGGFSFELDVEAHTVFPGDQLHELQINLPDRTLFAEAVIKTFRPGQEDAIPCGVKLLDFATAEDRRAWHAFVFAQAHPRLQRTSVDLDEVWDVFASSTYLDQWVGSGRVDEIRAHFQRDWKASDKSSGELLLLKEASAPIGTIAANQIYPRTWLMHSLAVDKRQRGKAERLRFLDLARELYSGMMYSLQHISGSGYFLAYFEEGKSWNQRLYRDFARDYANGADQLYQPCLVYRKSDHSADAAGGPAANVEIARATAADLRMVARIARDRLSPMLVDAMAINEAGFNQGAFCTDFAQKGLKRSREVFLIIKDGQPTVAAICESGGEGLNIFGLLNLCWTIPLCDQAPAPESYRSLVQTVSAHYRALGTDDFLFIEGEPHRASALADVGLALVSPGIRWLARTDVLPAWLSYVENELAALSPGALNPKT